MRATGSFLALLRMALAGPASYFAFSDQEHVLLPEKLALGSLPVDRPALWFCRWPRLMPRSRRWGARATPLTWFSRPR